MNQPIESQLTEILIERNKFRAFVELVALDRYDRASVGLREVARKLLAEHPADEPDIYAAQLADAKVNNRKENPPHDRS